MSAGRFEGGIAPPALPPYWETRQVRRLRPAAPGSRRDGPFRPGNGRQAWRACRAPDASVQLELPLRLLFEAGAAEPAVPPHPHAGPCPGWRDRRETIRQSGHKFPPALRQTHQYGSHASRLEAGLRHHRNRRRRPMPANTVYSPARPQVQDRQTLSHRPHRRRRR